jgi:ribosome recycling factor
MEEKEIMEKAKTGMHGAVDHLKQELRAIRAGRANPAIVEGVTVEVYGSQMKMKEVATISMPEPRQLLISPFDVNNAGLIVKAIDKANLGVRASLEGKQVRVFFPELDQSRRKALVAQVHEMKEKCKITVRNIRREINEKLKSLKSEGTIPEDDIKRIEKHVQEMTDHGCKDADEAATAKEKEVMTV